MRTLVRIPVWYKDKTIDIELPDSGSVHVYGLPAERLTSLPNDHWINSGKAPDPLIDFLQQDRRLLIAVNDVYRPTPTAKILKSFSKHLDLKNIRFLVATGLHHLEGEGDLERIFGDLASDANISVHDAFDDANMTEFGSGADSVRLNKLFDWCEAILIIGSVEPHYFAGFTGGRKIVLPGCASFKDVERNHANAVSELSQPLKRAGNPVWEDIQTRTSALDDKPRYAIQVVCDHDQHLFFVSHGDWDEAYDQACDFVIDNFSNAVRDPYDVIISVVYPPLDRNLYQLQKSYEDVAMALRDGGTILLISACVDGIGDDRFITIAESRGQATSSGDCGSEKMMMGIHKVTRTFRLAERIKLVLCSTLDGNLFRSLPIAARSKIQPSVDELISQYGYNCKIAVVLDAASQVLCRAA